MHVFPTRTLDARKDLCIIALIYQFPAGILEKEHAYSISAFQIL